MTTLVDPGRSQRTSSPAADQDLPRADARSAPAAYARRVLAGSGFVMLAFVVLHMLGNLLVFAGSGTFNAYARSLRELGTPIAAEGTLLWLARAVLAAALALHLAAHGYLFFKPAPVPWPVPSGKIPPWYATLPTAWLFATGALIAAFVAFHLAQLTLGATHPAFIADNPYHNLVSAIEFWPVSVAYIGAALAVGAHLLPGLWTGMRSLGLIRPGTESLAARLSVGIPAVLVIGMSAAPIAVLLGIVR